MEISKADFQTILSQARDLVKDELSATEKVIWDVAESAPKGISERLKTLFSRKGKRIRSTLLCLIANSGAQAPDMGRVARACAGVELLHLASLVHDDIIDGTEIRRGEETAHVAWGTQVAVLIGDYVLSQAMRCVIHEEQRDIPVILSNSADKLIAGEIMELDHVGDMRLTYDAYNQIIDGKTAALLDGAARIGAYLAGFNKDQIELCAEMGSHFGIAFQIIDDLLDYGFGSKNLDKAKFTDISNGLITLPLLYYFEQCNDAERAEMEDLVNRVANEDLAAEIVEKLNQKGVFEKTKAKAQEHLDKALSIAETFPESKFTDNIVDLLASMGDRGN